MNPDQIRQSIQTVIEGLTPLAQKLQIPIEQMWGWSIKHNYAIAMVGVVAFLFCLVADFIVYRWIKWGMGKEEGHSYSRFYNDDGPLTIAVVVPAILLSALTLMVTINLLADSIPRLIAPEYHTAKDIVQLIKGENN